MYKTSRFLAAAPVAASFLLLAACNSEPETITAEREDPQATALKNAAPVQLPPAIAASRTYRCKDNSLIYVDFFNDNKTANFRTDRAAPPTVLTAAEPGQPYTAEGYSVSANAATITIRAPGKGTQSCKA